jgi:hypothetical protein
MTNPYQAPSSNLDVIDEHRNVGGTLEDGVAGRYNFTISEVLAEAWNNVSGAKWAVNAGMLGVWIFMMLATIVLVRLGVMDPQNQWQGQIISMLLSAITYPCIAGISMMGVHRAVGLSISPGMIFGYFGAVLPLVLASLIQMFVLPVAFLLLVIPGIYLMVAYILTWPLIIDKKLGPWRAMEASRKAVTHQWFKFFGVGIIVMVVMMISAIPMGIGLIWSLPWAVMTLGVLYRHVFGVEAARQGRVIDAQ